MKLQVEYSYEVLQAHKGDNGSYFNAWSSQSTPDILKAVLLAQESIYNREKLGKVLRVCLVKEYKRNIYFPYMR